MKKIVKVVALLSIVAAVMMGCKNPAGGNNNTPSDPPAPGDNGVEPKELLTASIESQANVVSFEDLKAYAVDYGTISITVKNDNDEDRSYWGIVTLLLTDAEDPWSWHGKVLGEGEYGQLPPAGNGNLEAGESYTYEFALSDLIDALDAEETSVADGKKHQLTIQTGSKCPVTSVKLSAK